MFIGKKKQQIAKQDRLAQNFIVGDLYSQLNSQLSGKEHHSMENVGQSWYN